QAEDGIRDGHVTGVQTCALPIYISEGWDIAKFHAQEESNLLAEDLEVITQLLREDFKLRPEESGASVIGNLTLEEITRNGDRKRINCRDDVGDAGYTIPYNVEKEKE